MLKLASLFLCLPCLLALSACVASVVSMRRPILSEELLVGVCTREQIQQAMSHWQRPQEDLSTAQARLLGKVPPGAELTIYFGTWCDDSERELVRFWQALDALDEEPPFQVRYIGVDRQKRAPDIPSDLKLRFVPTFVVSKNGKEIGRIVESAPRGLEIELESLFKQEGAK